MKTRTTGAWAGRRYGVRPWFIAIFALSGIPRDSPAQEFTQEGREPPLYPSIITTTYDGKVYPVTVVKGEVPHILAEGKLRWLPSDQSYQTPRAAGYAPGYVQFTAQGAQTETRTLEVRMRGVGTMNQAFPAGTLSSTGDYECTLVSSEAHKGCFIAVVFYLMGPDGEPDGASTAMAFRDVGDLVGGRQAKVVIHSGYRAPQGKRFYFFSLVYTRGVEIRSDQSEIAARFFHRGEMAAHAALMARYRQQNPASDLPARAYLRSQPLLPVGYDPRSLPPTITARFAVTETGEVDSLELAPAPDEKADREIRRAINGWLFMPRLKKGIPVRAMVEVPLSFSAASS